MFRLLWAVYQSPHLLLVSYPYRLMTIHHHVGENSLILMNNSCSGLCYSLIHVKSHTSIYKVHDYLLTKLNVTISMASLLNSKLFSNHFPLTRKTSFQLSSPKVCWREHSMTYFLCFISTAIFNDENR